MNEKLNKPAWCYGLAVVIAVAATALRWALIPWMGTAVPYSIGLSAVVVATVLLGLGPALLSLLLVIVGGEIFIIGSLQPMLDGARLLRLGVSVAAGVFISGVLHALRVAQINARENAAQLATFAAATFEGIVESKAGRIVDCNEQAAKMFGSTVAELKDVAIADLIVPEDRERVMVSIYENRESVVEHALLRKDGTRMIVEAHGRPLAPGSVTRHTAIRDITERNRAEEVLRENEARRRVAEAVGAERKRFHDVLETLSAYVVLLTPDYHILFANRFFRGRFGESHGRRCYEHLFHRTKPCENCETYTVIETRTPHRWEWTGPDGRDYDVHDFLFTDTDGSPLVLEMGVDITERKQAEATVRESEDRYRSLVATSMDAVLLTAPDGRILGANAAACRMFERSEEELIRLGRNAVVDVSDPRLQAALAERDRTGRFSGELTFLRNDGTKFPGEISSAVFRNSKGELHTSIVIRDITERKRVEKELQRFASFPRFNPNPALDVDVAGTVTYCNPAAAEMVRQLGVEDARGFVPPEWGEIVKALQERPAEAVQREVRLKDRLFEERICLATGFDSVRIYARDITERKRAERELQTSRQALRALAARLRTVREEERARIAREVHDELGHALINLKLDLAWLERRLKEKSDPDKSGMRGRISAMIKRVEGELGMVRRIAAELRPAVLDTLGLAAAMEWAAKQFENRTRIACELDLPSEALALDTKRSTALFRIFQEILANIARHAGASRIQVRLVAGTGQVVLEVSDNGRGITAREVSDPNAIGLLGMRERALEFGGELTIFGAPGKGTSVRTTIPL